MRLQVTTWNTQGMNTDKWHFICSLAQKSKVIFVQETGRLSNPPHHQSDGLHIYGWSGVDTDGYYNNRVSLAIVSRYHVLDYGFAPAYDRGLGYIIVGPYLFGTWHEKRGQGGLGMCLQQIFREKGQKSCIIGGDFNDVRMDPIFSGRYVLKTTAYNWWYSGTLTHPGSGRNLDRVYVSTDLTMVHQWATPTPLSDHNPVHATVVDSRQDFTYWESFKSYFV